MSVLSINLEVIKTMIYLEVAVAAPLHQTLTYTLNKSTIQPDRLVGVRVLVPLGRRKITGYVVGLQDEGKEFGFTIRHIDKILDGRAIFHKELLHFFKWISEYYNYPLGLVIKAALPAGLTPKTEKRLVIQPEKIADLNEILNGQTPNWLEKIINEGGCSAHTVRKITSDKEKKNLLNKLLKSEIALIQNQLTKDSTKVKYEKCYSLKSSLPLSIPDSIDSKNDFEKLRNNINIQLDVDVKLSETKALYYLLKLAEHTNDPNVLAKDIRKKYRSASSALKSLEEKRIIKMELRRVFRNPFGNTLNFQEKPKKITSEQKSCLKPIIDFIKKSIYHPFLLHGVTGSGKTEVYLRASETAVKDGKKVLVLVPEIALATQLEAHFVSRFQDRVALLHSSLTKGEKFDQYFLALEGKVQIVIGARSAIFAPFKDLGLIIVDEEHDSSFKQDEGLLYHARDLAILRGTLQNCVVILGSATPSITSYARAQSGSYTLLEMTKRIGGVSLPETSIVDLTNRDTNLKKNIIQEQLLEKLQENLKTKKQSILLINRRGFSAIYMCGDCGTPIECDHCNISLTYHKDRERLLCHYCGFSSMTNVACGNCRGSDFIPIGFGTERIEEEIQKLFPEARIARIDSDSAANRRVFLSLLSAMYNNEIDILIGTQMLAKGHHFPNVSLVGVVFADIGMNIPDYKAAERTFQLITQVTGRAGRGGTRGEVVIQTMRPEYYPLKYACKQDYTAFYNFELQMRKNPLSPPFVRLVLLRLSGRIESKVRESARALSQFCRNNFAENKKEIQVLGPAPSPLIKIQNKYRFQVLLKGTSVADLSSAVKIVAENESDYLEKSCRIVIDVDPEKMM